MFKVKKPFLLLEIPYFEQNKIASKRFIKKFHQFTLEKYDVAVKWLTKEVKSLYIRHAKFIKVYAIVKKLTLVKPFVMLKNLVET